MPIGTPGPRFPGLSQLAAEAAAQLPPSAPLGVNPWVAAAQQFPGLAGQYPGLVVPTSGQVGFPAVLNGIPISPRQPYNADLSGLMDIRGVSTYANPGYARKGFERGAAKGVNRAVENAVSGGSPLAQGQEAARLNSLIPGAFNEPMGTGRVGNIPSYGELWGDPLRTSATRVAPNVAESAAARPMQLALPAESVSTQAANATRQAAAQRAAQQALGTIGTESIPLSGASAVASKAPSVIGLADEAAMLAGGGIPMTEAAAATAATAGRQGLLSRLGIGGAAAAGEAGAAGGASGLLAKVGGPAALAKAGGWYMGGQLASGLFDSIVGEKDGTTDDAISEALKYGGMGAAGGSFFGPWGTAIGGGIGLTVGGIKGWLTGDDSIETQTKNQIDKSLDKFNESIGQMSVSSDLRNSALAQLKMGMAMAESPDQVKQMTQSVLQQVMQAAPADMLQQEDRMRREALQASMQAWMGPMLQKSIAQQNFYANAQSDILNEIAGQYTSPTMRGTTRALAASIPADAATRNAMLLAQIATTPSMYGYSAQGPVIGSDINSADVMGATPTTMQGDAFTQMLAQQMAQQQAMAAG